MNDAPSLKNSLARWPGFPKLERRFEPRRTRAAAGEVTKRLGDIEPKPPEPYDLNALYSRVMGTWRRRRSLEGVSSRDFQRLPWVLFYEPREHRRTRRKGSTGWLGGKPRVIQDYRRWLSRARRARSVQALLHEFLRVYPTDLRTFDDLREVLQVSVFSSSSPPPSLRKWRQRCLTHAGFDAGLARCEFLKSGIRKYLRSISPQLARNRVTIPSLDRLLTLLECDGKLRFDVRLVRVEVASALLRPFVDGPPESAIRERLQSFFVRHFGHPNLRSRKHKWVGVPHDIRRVVIRWLVERVLDQFFLLVKETALDRHWRYREAFWRAYLRDGLIDDIWFLLGTRAEEHLRNINRKNDLTESTGLLHHAGGDQSVLLLRMPGVTIAEWSHNGSCRCWLDGNRNAPKLYQKEYSRHTLMQGSDFAQPHFGSERGYWQDRVADWLRENTGATVSRRRRSQRSRTKSGRFPARPVSAGLSASLNDPERQWTTMANPKANKKQAKADTKKKLAEAETPEHLASVMAEIQANLKAVASADSGESGDSDDDGQPQTLAGLMDSMLIGSEPVKWTDVVRAAGKLSKRKGLTMKITVGAVRAHAKARHRWTTGKWASWKEVVFTSTHGQLSVNDKDHATKLAAVETTR